MNTNLAYRLEHEVEIIGGQVVMMAPPLTRHTRTERNLAWIFERYLRGRTCEYFLETGLFLQEDQEEYIPDGIVVCDPEKVRDRGIYGAPDLVIEILSLSTASYDRGHKMKAYEAAGVREYWIVDPLYKTVEQYVLTDGAFVLAGFSALHPEDDLGRLKREELEKKLAEFPREFRCSLFDDLVIRLEDVFYRVQ